MLKGVDAAALSDVWSNAMFLATSVSVSSAAPVLGAGCPLGAGWPLAPGAAPGARALLGAGWPRAPGAALGAGADFWTSHASKSAADSAFTSNNMMLWPVPHSS